METIFCWISVFESWNFSVHLTQRTKADSPAILASTLYCYLGFTLLCGEAELYGIPHNGRCTAGKWSYIVLGEGRVDCSYKVCESAEDEAWASHVGVAAIIDVAMIDVTCFFSQHTTLSQFLPSPSSYTSHAKLLGRFVRRNRRQQQKTVERKTIGV